MNISIISFGHVDSITALSKYLSLRSHLVNLFIVVYDDRFLNSIVDFNLRNLSYGLTKISDLKKKSSDTDYLLDYIKDFNCWLLKLPSRSLKDIRNLKYIYSCYSYVNKLKSDIVHFNGSSSFQILFYILFRKLPKIYTIHDFIQHSGSESFRNTFYNWLHTKCNYIFIQHSEYLKKLFLEKSNIKENKVHTVYYAPFDFYDYYKNGDQIQEEFPSAIFFGRISSYKGIEYFCKAIEIVNRYFPEAKYYILGNGEFYFDINYYSQKFPITIINKHIDNQTLSEYILRSSLVIIPYKDATQSGVVVTSYSFNKPVIATQIGGIPEIVINGETGFLVEPKNSQMIAEKMIELFSDKALLTKMQNNIKQLKNDKNSRFMSWEKIAEETEGIYNSAIN